jgi:hypothetical protein
VADFRAFLAPQQPVVLPYFGGTRVDAADRRLRVEAGEGELALGWWQFRVEGRRAVPVQPASPVELGALPRIRGHWVDGWIIVDGKQNAHVALPPDDEPAPFARASARRWYSGDVLLETLEFEDDAELEARRALEELRPLGELRGVAPSLRVAFGIALGAAISRELAVAVSVRELVPRAVAIAEHGRAAVIEWFEHVAAERQRAAEEVAAERRRIAEEARRQTEQMRAETAAGTARAVRRHGDPVQRADDALDGARARMLSCRRLERGTRLDVTYEVDGTRILSIVESETLRVIDPGICLDGAHGVLTLDAMPSVVREAIEEHHLNITRRA